MYHVCVCVLAAIYTAPLSCLTLPHHLLRITHVACILLSFFVLYVPCLCVFLQPYIQRHFPVWLCLTTSYESHRLRASYFPCAFSTTSSGCSCRPTFLEATALWWRWGMHYGGGLSSALYVLCCTMLYYAVLYCGGGEQRIMVDVSNALF